jgi:hypothetical protein
MNGPDERPRNYSLKATEWLDFSSKVFKHIENYVVPQYGDHGSDPCTEYDFKDFVRQIEKYIKRFGRNSREGQDKLDLLKIAHYACMLHSKISEKDK